MMARAIMEQMEPLLSVESVSTGTLYKHMA